MKPVKNGMEKPALDAKTETLIAIGAATASNCIPCFEHIYEKAITSGITSAEINRAADAAGGALNRPEAKAFRERYRRILQEAETECPPPDESERKKGQRGRLKRSKARSLLERLLRYEEDVLRFTGVAVLMLDK